MKQICIENLERIISHPKLQLKNEDQLFEFINDLYESKRSSSILYSHVLFSYASVEMISKFVEVFNKEDLTEDIWEAITQRLISDIKTKKVTSTRYKEKPKPQGKLFSPKGESTFDGIMIR